MHSVTFHNLGNADSTRITVDCGRKLLFDYANMRDPNDGEDLRCDLPKELRDDLGKRDYFDVVAVSHLDRDHYAGATDFFHFEHIAKYQGAVDGKRLGPEDLRNDRATMLTRGDLITRESCG